MDVGKFLKNSNIPTTIFLPHSATYLRNRNPDDTIHRHISPSFSELYPLESTA